ncbi:hypothetical protein SAMN05216389_110135 [Oceanobacillus limi]|uniref:Uncharacterized protein n=1 Tax=Oceanobacillus limi TaxID=930131 RepID=A0A1I0E5X9_9BACI|nr:DUF6516 family protein [Oceanobacillus limi]SET40441.1 hypothetical protein SAMN05216389_110135 [Oceanobacillus limi]
MSRETEKVLLPADIPDILEKYGDLLCNYPQLPTKDSIYGNYKRTNKKLSVLFPLIEHPVHGKTGLHATEKYEDGYVTEYHYQWKIIIPKMGKLFHHISAWENEPHDAPWTPGKYKVKSEPHHHHHVPGNRDQRKENWDILTLDNAFSFVAHYIRSRDEYKP